MVVGEAPGKSEVREEIPFIGKSGKILRATLQQETSLDVWIPEDDFRLENKDDQYDVYYTNTVKCRPNYNETPQEDSLKACRDSLWQEINEVDPDLILTVGLTSSQQILDKPHGIYKIRGRFYEREGYTVLPTIHPAAPLHADTPNSTYKDFQDDVSRVDYLLNEGPFDLDLETQYLVAKSPQQGINFIDELHNKNRIAWDLETTGFEWWKNDILSMSASWKPNQAVVFQKKLFQSHSFIRELKSLLERKDIDFILQNGQFDVPWMKGKFNIETEIDDDTLLIHNLLDERKGVHSLEYLAQRYLNAPDYEKQMLKEAGIKDKSELADAPKHLLHEYSAKDSDYTLRLYYVLKEKAQEAGYNV